MVFLYRDVLDKTLTEEIAPIRSKRQQRPPAVLIQSEVQRLLAVITGKHALMAKLLYGGGLRLMECIRLCVKDLDEGFGVVYIPEALARKYPNAGREIGWQWVFPSGVNIRVLQELLGHADVKTTEIYTHVMARFASWKVHWIVFDERCLINFRFYFHYSIFMGFQI